MSPLDLGTTPASGLLALEAHMLDIIERIRSFIDMSEAEMSHRDVADLLRTALGDDLQLSDDQWIWVLDVYDDRVVYEVEGGGEHDLFMRPYQMSDDGSVTFGEPVEVRRVTTYEPVSRDMGESATLDARQDRLSPDVVPLVERAVADDGTVPIKLIEPGWGASGYYSTEVLQNAAPVFNAGTHMYLDHPSESEMRDRPERSLKDLAGVLIEDARWDEDGPQGPGLYAAARVFSPFRELLDEMAPHIGVSIRAVGHKQFGEAEGREGDIVTEIVDRASVDFVTLPGAGGAIGELLESARGRAHGDGATEEETVDDVRENTQAPESTEQVSRLQETVARLEEQLMLRDARDFVLERLAGRNLPAVTQRRLIESLAKNPPTTDAGDLDREAFGAQIDEAVKAELAYLEEVSPSGRIRGFGPAPEPTLDPEPEQVTEALTASLARFGLSETAARAAAAGRR